MPKKHSNLQIEYQLIVNGKETRDFYNNHSNPTNYYNPTIIVSSGPIATTLLHHLQQLYHHRLKGHHTTITITITSSPPLPHHTTYATITTTITYTTSMLPSLLQPSLLCPYKILIIFMRVKPYKLFLESPPNPSFKKKKIFCQ